MSGRRAAGLYSRAERLYVYPYGRTTSGVLIGLDPVIVVASSSTDEALGLAATDALKHFKAGVRHPSIEEFSAIRNPVLEAAKMASLAAFAKGARACEISEEGGVASITPTRAGPRKGTFLSLPEDEVRAELAAGPAVLGAAIRAALARCR